jgi:hypothetical protein
MAVEQNRLMSGSQETVLDVSMPSLSVEWWVSLQLQERACPHRHLINQRWINSTFYKVLTRNAWDFKNAMCARVEIVVVVKMSNVVFGTVMPCGPVAGYQCFGGTYHVHCQNLTQKMEVKYWNEVSCCVICILKCFFSIYTTHFNY